MSFLGNLLTVYVVLGGLIFVLLLCALALNAGRPTPRAIPDSRAIQLPPPSLAGDSQAIKRGTVTGDHRTPLTPVAATSPIPAVSRQPLPRRSDAQQPTKTVSSGAVIGQLSHGVNS